MPYRVDVPHSCSDALDRLIELGALDVAVSRDGETAALIPDSVTPAQIATALRIDDISISSAVGRDAESVWVLKPRPIRIGRIRIVPAEMDAEAGVLRLIDTPAFGTGLHPTTALCLEALDETVQITAPDDVLDVGTGSGVLALTALMLGVPRAFAIDVDDQALRAAHDNARINGVGERLQLARGGPEVVTGTWPLVVANILAAPLVEMAPGLVRHIGHHGRLVLSGIANSVEPDVHNAYRRLGMTRLAVKSRAGWIALVMQASW